MFAKRHGARRVVDRATSHTGSLTLRTRVELDVKGGRYYTASQLLADGFDRQYTATCLGYGDGGNVL